MSNKHKISLAEAKAMTRKYRTELPHILAGKYAGTNALLHHATIDRSAIEEILRQPGCISLRIHLGMNTRGEVTPIFVGVDADGVEMLANEILMDDTRRCPPNCEPISTLQDD